MKFIKLKEVMVMTGLARATVYKHIANNKFPKSVSLGERAVAWIESEVEEWMLERIAERDEAIIIG
ncbi:helix-turn-helix transcriptional regulator [Psychromonas antarctica]|uniref:helix-turn-helix transcriptional regulator n=1 Tax=Psychromonas antarctica TaxID=67573 RepID=UPI001EE89080|nr:AlpA family transcriptional regulator [Psychromonas antarctica]MCG6202329.1 AlpA family transcriptional regulator [Psychromonas antarctica]